MKSIGGYFSLETGSGNKNPHPDALNLSYGRTCLRLIIETLKPKKIWVPYYVCDSLLTPLIEHNIPYQFYSVDKNLEPNSLPSLKLKEYFLYINYFGLKSEKLYSLFQKYGHRLIIDNTQAFFWKPRHPMWSFNSARKFFGVPDGAYLYSPKLINAKLKKNEKISFKHLTNRSAGRVKLGYQQFVKYESSIRSDVVSVSNFSKTKIGGLNLMKIASVRRKNYAVYNEILGRYNELDFQLLAHAVPLCYPLLTSVNINRQLLANSKIFIPTYWEECLVRKPGFLLEKRISSNLLPLPIDHRYSANDCARVAKLIIQQINQISDTSF